MAVLAALAARRGAGHHPHVAKSLLRTLRHALTDSAMDTALALAPRLSPSAIARVRRAIARLGPRTPLLARRVASNMRGLGVYTPGTLRAHFAQLGAHFAGVLHVLRNTPPPHADLWAEIHAQLEMDAPSAALLRSAHAAGGLVLTGPHLTNFLLGLTLVHSVVPLTIYFRTPKHARQRRAKQRWFAASGITPIFEDVSAGSGSRVGQIAAAVHAGQAVYVPPDLPRKLGEGVAVRFLGRLVELPAGAAVLAARTHAPLFVLVGQQAGARQRLVLRGPAPQPTGEVRQRVQQLMQWIANELETWLRAEPALWYFWLDKRWTRVIRNDPRYTRAVEAACCR